MNIQEKNTARSLFISLHNDTFHSLSEKQKRLFAASFVLSSGHGSYKIVHEVTGLSLPTIRKGVAELQSLIDTTTLTDSTINDIIHFTDSNRIRRIGGGRYSALILYPNLLDAIKAIIEESSYGDPMSNKEWTTCSLSVIQDVLLYDCDIQISQPTISKCLKQMGYSLQENKKMLQVGKPHPDRDKQFHYIQEVSNDFLTTGDPVISVDTKKKELIGTYANSGKEYRRVNDPRYVLDHDFLTTDGYKAIPYGIYVINSNHGFVNIGISHDTPQFAVASIKKWWLNEGVSEFPMSTRILILCDGGGSNSSRSRLFKYELGLLANEIHRTIHVSHFPPGTSKWNKIEHRLFSEISKTWKAKPLYSLEVMKNLIRSTKTKTGLYVHAEIDTAEYASGIRLNKRDIRKVKLQKKETCSQWNYIIEGLTLE